MSAKTGPHTGRPSVEGLPVSWRKQAKALRRYGGETPAVVLDRCADDLEATLQELDETTLSLVEAASEIRDGKIPNAGRPGAPRIARNHLPRKCHSAGAPPQPRLGRGRREVSSRQIVESVIQRGIE